MIQKMTSIRLVTKVDLLNPFFSKANSGFRELFKKLTGVSTIVSPNKMDNIFHFYGRTRKVFFDVINAAAGELMIDLSVKKLGLRDLLDSEFAGRGLD